MTKYTSTTHEIADRIESGELSGAKVHLKGRIPDGEKWSGQPTGLFPEVSVKELRSKNVVVNVHETPHGNFAYLLPNR